MSSSIDKMFAKLVSADCFQRNFSAETSRMGAVGNSSVYEARETSINIWPAPLPVRYYPSREELDRAKLRKKSRTGQEMAEMVVTPTGELA